MLLCYHNEVKKAFNTSNIIHTNTISTMIPTSYTCYLQSLYTVHLPNTILYPFLIIILTYRRSC